MHKLSISKYKLISPLCPSVCSSVRGYHCTFAIVDSVITIQIDIIHFKIFILHSNKKHCYNYNEL